LELLLQFFLFHDSLHSERNVRFELDRAWPILRPGGAIVVDDIDANNGFHSFNEDFPGYPYFVCEAEPLQDDPRHVRNYSEDAAAKLICRQNSMPIMLFSRG
jgi:methyltransferase family protein